MDDQDHLLHGAAASWSQAAWTASENPGNRPLLTALRERLEWMCRAVRAPAPL